MEKDDSLVGLAGKAEFYQLVDESLSRRKVDLLPETKIYLVGVAQDLVKQTSEVNDGQPVTLAYSASLQEQNKGKKIRKLLEVGDRCLILVGFFPDSITKRQGESGLEYHVKIGSSAYIQVGSSLHEKQPLFFELAERFTDLTKVLGDIYSPSLHSLDNLAEIVQRWQKTKDPRYYTLLLAHGMIPYGEGDVNN